MTQTELAAHLDLGVRNLRNTLQLLGLPTAGTDPDAARVAYIRHLRKQAARWSGTPTGTAKADLDVERTGLIRARREKAELEAAAMRRSMLPSVDVESSAFSFYRAVRDRLMGIPRRLAATLAAESDQRGVEIVLTNEISEVLTELSKDGTEPGFKLNSRRRTPTKAITDGGTK